MKTSTMLSALVIAMAMAFATGCASSDYSRIPDNGYLAHLQKNQYPDTVPMDSYWDAVDDQEWNERVKGANGKSQKVLLRPVRIDYFSPALTNDEDRAAVKELGEYLETSLSNELRRLSERDDNTLQLVDKPGPDVYELEVALLTAQGANRGKNAIMQVPGFFISLGSFITGRIFGEKEDTGYVSIGGKVYDGNGRQIAEIADFQYGMRSLVGRVAVDTKDFRVFAYQRETIDVWSEQIGKLMTYRREDAVKRRRFSLNPF